VARLTGEGGEPAAGDGRARWVEVGTGVAASVLGLLGAGASGVYLWSAIQVLDQADRSVVFWYAIFLLLGLTFTIWAATMLLWLLGRVRGRERARRRVKTLMVFVIGTGGAVGLAGVALACWHLFVI
jgi:hypothetical protein